VFPLSTSNPQPPPNPDAYLDGQLDAAGRAAFERAMRDDPALARQVALQRRIDQSLGRLFAASDRSAGRVAPAAAAGARPIAFRPLTWSIAAAVLVGVALVVYFLSRPGTPAGPGPLPGVYQGQVAAGFTPQVVCTTVPDFAAWVNQYYGQSLYPPEKHEGVEFVGWNYAPAVSSNSGVLLATVGDKKVIVVLDRKVREKKPLPTPQGGEGLHVFRREVGSVVAYEVTPLDHPSILPILETKPHDR
jgi:hypothetical protein